MLLKLREYQERLVSAVFEKWRAFRSTLIVAATGTGKTNMFAEIIRRSQPGRALVLAHRTELILQAVERIESFGLPCEIEKADLVATTNLFHATPVVVSSIQTQCSGPRERRRYTRFKPTDFSLLVADECFPAGTIVSGMPIESLTLGDSVATHRGVGIVEQIFRREVHKLIRFTLEDGRSLTCTENHPIWSNGCFSCASDFTVGDVMLTITDNEYLHHLSYTNSERSKALRETELQKRTQSAHDSKQLQKARRRDHKISQDERNERSPSTSKGVNATQGNGLEAGNSGRKRTRSDNLRTGSSISLGVGFKCLRQNQDAERKWLPPCVQAGHWQSAVDDRGRSRWELTLSDRAKKAGFKKGRIATFVRVARIEVFQRRNRERFATVCPDDFVYNLTVSNGNTYLANGILVHNCHHAASSTWREVIDYYRQNPNLKVLGVTATPDRADREALGQVFESVAGTYDILDAIEDGYLVDITQQFCTVRGLDYSHIKTTAGDLNEGQLSKVMELEDNAQRICQATLEVMHGLQPQTLDTIPVPDWRAYFSGLSVRPRRTIVFTVSVLQAEVYCDVLSRAMDGVEWVCGKTRKEDRAAIGTRFYKGETHCVVNCAVYSEGYDNPFVEVIIQARPTKSRSFYAQTVGRSTRPLPGIVDAPDLDTPEKRRAAIAASEKPFCRILDFVGNSGKHKLVTCLDILGGKVSPDAAAFALKKAQAEGKPVRVLRAMTKAEQEVERKKAEDAERRRRQESARKAHLLARSQYSMRNVNPFDQGDSMQTHANVRRGGKEFSVKQAAFLRKWCGVDPARINYGYGVKLIQQKTAQWDKKVRV